MSLRTQRRRELAAAGHADYDFCRCGEVKRAKSKTCAACRVHLPNSGCFSRGGPRPGGSPRAPIGAERLDAKHGEIFTKVSHDNPWRRDTNSGLWMPRRIVNWVRQHGPVPDGLIVRRLVDDRLDDRPENMVLISRRVNALLNSGHWVRPRLRWSMLPPDKETRLAACASAVAVALANEAGGGRARRRRS